MSRTADQALDEMLALLPPGWAWPRGSDSLMAAVLRPMATGIAELEAMAEAGLIEVDPNTASAAIPDFERLLGADPCGRDFAALPLTERRRVAQLRYTARGGASRAYFEALAAAQGVPITIAETIVSQSGETQAGDELIGDGEQFFWRVTLPLGAWREAEAGDAACGDLVYDFAVSDLECEIRRRAPAHTEPVFYYEEAA